MLVLIVVKGQIPAGKVPMLTVLVTMLARGSLEYSSSAALIQTE